MKRTVPANWLCGWLPALVLLSAWPAVAGTAADVARALRESEFDRDECYRVRDLTVVKEDVRIYLTDGYLIFSRPVAGRPIAAVFSAELEGGDGEVLLLPPDRAERKSLATYTQSPNLDEHFRTVLLLFTGNEHETLTRQMAQNSTIRKMPDVGAMMAERWNPVLHNLAESFQVRITLDLLGGPRRGNLLAALFNSSRLGNFDVVYDPDNSEQILAAQIVTRNNQSFYDTWTSFRAKSVRDNPQPAKLDVLTSAYRIDATVDADLGLSAVTRVKVKTTVEGTMAVPFAIATAMAVTEVRVDGQPAEVLQRDSLRESLGIGGNSVFLVAPREPLHAGRDYEFEFHHSGKVIVDAGDRVLFVTARGNWYPVHGLQFANYDLRFRFPRDLEVVAAGDVVEDRIEGDWRVTRRRTSSTIRMAGFNLGNYAHARVERGAYVVDVCANRALEKALLPRPVETIVVPPPGKPLHGSLDSMTTIQTPPPPDPLARLHSLAVDIAAAMEFMTSKFGPPALPHLTVSPIPGSFGQGFPGLIYLSTLAYLKQLPDPRGAVTQSQELFFEDIIEAHETAHQWWGNRVTAATYRDNWLMEALANYSALLYLEKTKGPHALDVMLDSYRSHLLEKNESGTVESAGPIVLGGRLSSSVQPAGWNAITYGKGSWIMQMLRRRMGDANFFAMLGAILQRYDHADITTEEFRLLAAGFQPKSDDPKLEAFFDQWVYGTGIPSLKLSYSVKGVAPALRLTGTVTQTDADDNVSVSVPVEIQVARGAVITEWVRTGSEPSTFSVPLKQAPLKVTLDPNHAVLRR